MEENRKHTVSMENRERIIISDVEDVESFDEEKVCVLTSMGILTVEGSDFRMHKLDVEAGQLIIEGIIDELKYSESHRQGGQCGFFSRLFQ